MGRQTRLKLWTVVKVVCFIAAAQGCCWATKRSCFPACPVPIVKTITVELPCELPPKLILQKISRSECAGESIVCFDRRNAALLARRQSSMKDWILEARKRCSQNSSTP